MRTSPRPLPPTRAARRALWASAASILAMAVVAATPGSPFQPVMPDVEPNGPFRAVSDLLALGRLSPLPLILVGVASTVVAATAFLFVLREAWRGRVSVRTVLLLAVAYHVVALMVPLLFSRDVYSYAYYGRMVSTYGDNPYVATPRDYDLNSLFHLTWPGWRGTPSVYGPLFTWLSALLTTAVKAIPGIITAFQAIAAAASVATAAIVARTARRVAPGRAAFATALIGLNPIVVFHVVAGGHNDMLVAMLVAAATAALFAHRRLGAALLLALAMSVKATAAIPLALLLVAVAAATSPARRRRELAVYVGSVAALWLAFAVPFLQLENPTLGTLNVAGNDSWMAPGQLVVRAAGALAGAVAGDGAVDAGRTAARVALYAMSAVALAAIAREVWRRPEARTPAALAAAWGWGLLVLILPSPVLYTWYLVWILPLAWALPKVPRRGLVILSAFFLVTQLATESTRLPDYIQGIRFPFGHPIAVAVLVWVGRDLVRRLRAGTLLHEESEDPAFADALEAPATLPAAAPAVSSGAGGDRAGGVGLAPRPALDPLGAAQRRRA
jgi:alpha-1,6-mannosyltransferase